jgi:hypothetical protein
MLTREAAITLANPKDFKVIAHLGSLTIAAFTARPDLACETCWFLDSLLPYIGSPSIFALFERLCADDRRYQTVHRWLIEYGLAREIVRTLKDVNYLKKVDPIEGYADPMIERISGCYSLIVVAIQNPTLAPALLTSEVIGAVSRGFENPPDFARGMRWRALRWLCTPATIEQMTDIIDSVIQLQLLPNTQPTQDVVESLRFLNRAVSISVPLANRIAWTQIFQSLLGLLLRFDTASILHEAIRGFAMMAFHHPVLCDRAVELLLPFLMNEALHREHGFVAVTCWALLDALHREMRERRLGTDRLARNDEFEAFANNYLLRYRKRVSKSYGGDAKLD